MYDVQHQMEHDVLKGVMQANLYYSAHMVIPLSYSHRILFYVKDA